MIDKNTVRLQNPVIEDLISAENSFKKYFGLLYRLKSMIKYLGPAFIVSVAYIDPGNFAANISGGSKFNYSLIWVILVSNLMAIFLQCMSARLGIATGKNLPQMCGEVFGKKLNWFFLIVAELAAMATDLAEFLGATLGLYLLFHIPMPLAGLITAVMTFCIVYLSKYGQRIIEIVISALVTIICISYTMEVFLAKPDWTSTVLHSVMPSLPGSEAVLIAVGMLGATVMPHVIYLHSQLVQCRNNGLNDEQKIEYLRMEKIDIAIAMNIAFVVNAAMVVVAAAVFYRNGMVVETIEQAQKSLAPLLGNLSSGAFGIALLASGLSSSAVGTMAGQTILQGFVGLKVSDNVTRVVTMIPAMAIIFAGINPMNILLISQVILSFVLPMAIIPMLIITRRKDLMGIFVNKKITNAVGWVIALAIILLNAVLVFNTLI